MAASTLPRRGLAVSVVRIMPRRYSAVMNSTLSATSGISPIWAPLRDCWVMSTSGVWGATSPEPVSVQVPDFSVELSGVPLGSPFAPTTAPTTS